MANELERTIEELDGQNARVKELEAELAKKNEGNEASEVVELRAALAMKQEELEAAQTKLFDDSPMNPHFATVVFKSGDTAQFPPDSDLLAVYRKKLKNGF